MATARPFAYNPGATGPIPGTEQVGSLAVGTPANGFAATGLQWWNGPDEDLGYVIAQSVPSNTQPTPVSGVSASVGFFRSSALTDPSFISIANVVAGPSGPFASGSSAKTWLNANGYWTSYVGVTGATGGGYELVILPYNPPAAGDVIFPNFASTPSQGNTNPNIFATGGVYWNAVDINSVNQSSYYNGLIGNSATISFTQNGNTAIYSATNTAILFDGPTGSQAYNYNPNARPGQLTLTQASPSNFVVGQTVYISFA
jgi:hypothetical protein